jgi:hypothetical protein
MSITASAIRQVVISEDDFGHEMRVGKILNNVEYPRLQFDHIRVNRPSHGGTYKDQVTGKTRQFDYRCQMTQGQDRLKNIFLAVECKNLNPEYPLVVCGRPRTYEESYHLFIQREDDEKSSLRKVEGIDSFYKPDHFVGKSLMRLKEKGGKLCSDGDSEIYDRWSQALASSHDLAFGAVLNKPPPRSYAFVMPLVAVPNNSLWTVTYTDDGTVLGDPIQVDQCEYYVDQKLLIGLPFVITHIHFLTLKGLSQMISNFVVSRPRAWDTIFSNVSSVFDPYS